MTHEIVAGMMRRFILNDHPCVMAQSVYATDSVELRAYGKFNDAIKDRKLLMDLKSYVDRQDEETKDFETFIAVFHLEVVISEEDFENKLWDLLNKLREQDNSPWDKNTSSDPESNMFSYSLHETSFYIVGMHPFSSRLARSAPYVTIVFNLHSQFELLREINRYDKVRDLIRRRDKKLQGSINPMLADFGTRSEARQYSGRAVDNDWKCPFNHGKK